MGQLTKAELEKRERLFSRSLSSSIRKKIFKLNPYVTERNRAIRDLAAKGVSFPLIARGSRLSIVQISRIVKGGGR
jgi:hypothetical protein